MSNEHRSYVHIHLQMWVRVFWLCLCLRKAREIVDGGQKYEQSAFVGRQAFVGRALMGCVLMGLALMAHLAPLWVRPLWTGAL